MKREYKYAAGMDLTCYGHKGWMKGQIPGWTESILGKGQKKLK